MRLQYKGLVTMLVFAVSALIISCSTDKRSVKDEEAIYPDKDIIDVTVNIDNGDLEVDENSEYTLIFYPVDGSKSSTFVVDKDEPKVSIKKGEYSVVVFNGTVNSHKDIAFKDIKAYKTIKVCFDGVTYTDTSSHMLYTDTQDLLSINSSVTSINFKLSDCMSVLHVTAYISSLNKLSTEGNVVIISGLAKGLYLNNRKPVESDRMSINVNLPIRKFNEGSSVDGYLRGQAKCFGLYSSEEVAPVNIASLILRSTEDTYIEVERDISGDIKTVAEEQVLSVDIPDIKL